MRIRKRRTDGVVQGYHVVGKGHSAEVLAHKFGRVLKRFTDGSNARDREYMKYVKYKLWKNSSVIPMKWTHKGLLMPKLHIITRSASRSEWSRVKNNYYVEDKNISNTQLASLLRGLRQLSQEGIAVGDILHVGIDKSGRAYFFDIGEFYKPSATWEAVDENTMYWEQFCDAIGHREFKDKLFRRQSNNLLQEFHIEKGMQKVFEGGR